MKSLYDFCVENRKVELLEQWDQAANGDMTPRTVARGSGKKVWWRCRNGHRWQAVVNSRTRGSGCPFCAGKAVLDGSNDLATQLPEIAAQWHPARNLPLTPGQVTRGSHQSVWWQCEKGHQWRATVKSRAEGNGCPVCAGRRLLTGFNDLRTVSPELAGEWHPERNGSLTPELVLASTTRRVWWRCQRGHEWQATVKERGRGAGCPVCGGQKVLAGFNDLASSYPLLAAEWHPVKNGALTPREVTVSSNRRIWWRCGLGHEWQASLYSRTRDQAGCPYCANRKVLAGFNDLATTQPEIAAQWHPALNGTLTPEQVTAGSKHKAWWICPEGHVWKTVIHARTGPRRTSCPICAGNISKKQQQRYERMEWTLRERESDS